MIEIYKLSDLPAKQRDRKILKILELAEQALQNKQELPFDEFYLQGLFKIAKEKISISPALLKDLQKETVLSKERVLFLINSLRHELYSITGSLPSEWDLIFPQLKNNSQRDCAVRPFFSGTAVYVENIRAPFNLGSIFRTAEAFGAEKIFLSEDCVSPQQPRAIRSAMGTIELVPWEHCDLENLPKDLPVFALETGGTPIHSFRFPEKGIVMIGSEELGLSPQALRRATAGTVSIPMYGSKASINVGVAFGILMHAWIEAVRHTNENL
ncbi:TrmH family RNA methyltransferase [Treponema phagedenis]|uniref:TrmH family RNA methyltransferase n=1 Tax=Treponema phagedenis TaxID=162 RepID=UPI0001F637EA|nr:TrmH family RNA methyltransferase [Treponema phagedenis]EFW36819.1 RNA methyltransferase, TrmH family [Treponema phagedenis F0421]TYT78683.1 TrmH family RNA methyltransferase [Treponema phagedenis]